MDKLDKCVYGFTLVAMLVCNICYVTVRMDHTELQQQAIKRGYAEWNIDKEFVWKDKK